MGGGAGFVCSGWAGDMAGRRESENAQGRYTRGILLTTRRFVGADTAPLDGGGLATWSRGGVKGQRCARVGLRMSCAPPLPRGCACHSIRESVGQSRLSACAQQKCGCPSQHLTRRPQLCPALPPPSPHPIFLLFPLPARISPLPIHSSPCLAHLISQQSRLTQPHI